MVQRHGERKKRDIPGKMKRTKISAFKKAGSLGKTVFKSMLLLLFVLIMLLSILMQV